MSDPRHGHKWDADREALMKYVQQGEIRCVFSQAHVVEMAPLDRTGVRLAVHKVDLMVALCGAFALPSLDRLVTSELTALIEEIPRIHDVIADDGKWYPLIDDFIATSNTKILSQESVSAAINEFGANRAQRRASQKKLLRKGFLKAQDPVNEIAEVQKIYPMREEDARTLARYVHGQATVVDAQQAFESSLRDPRFMMRWFASKNVEVTQFTSWLRDSSQKMKEVVEGFAAVATQIRALPEHIRGQVAPKTILAKDEWDRTTDLFIERVAQRIADELLPSSSTLSLSQLHQTCVGLSTMLKVFRDAAWASTTEQPRTPIASDLGDSYHALYSPYVDIFRADGFMAPHIARHANQFGTEVVSKLRHLVPAIQARLEARELQMHRRSP